MMLGPIYKKGGEMKKRLLIISVVVCIICIMVGVMISVLAKKQEKEMLALNYQNVDLAMVEDGSYLGECDTTLIKVSVEVTVTNHQIADITITRHINGKGKAAQAIVNEIKEQNYVDVDTISGATYSSKVIKSAIRNALIQGIKK